jgi:outer membrane receptor protein involved in Fe transport
VKAKDTDVNHSLLRRLTLAGVSAAALAAALPALAQETDVEGLIVTAQDYVPQGSVAAGKAGIPLVENPQSITVISRDQIDLLDWSTLGQVVRYTAGVNGENYGPDERVDWLTVRGFNPVQYIDGIQGSIGSITNTGLDLYGAQTVEILKGPASFLYGSAPPAAGDGVRRRDRGRDRQQRPLADQRRHHRRDRAGLQRASDGPVPRQGHPGPRRRRDAFLYRAGGVDRPGRPDPRHGPELLPG